MSNENVDNAEVANTINDKLLFGRYQIEQNCWQFDCLTEKSYNLVKENKNYQANWDWNQNRKIQSINTITAN